MKRAFDTGISRRRFLRASGAMATATAISGCGASERHLVKEAGRVTAREKHPVVVIGAGLGSLTTAAYFAKTGFPVTVVEQHHIPGGYASSFERSSDRHTYHFEVSLHMSAVKHSAGDQIIRELELTGVETTRLPELCRIIAPDLDITLPQADPEGCAQALARRFPDAQKGIQSFMDEIVGVAEETAAIGGGLTIMDKLLFPFRFPHLVRMYDKTLADLLDRHASDPKVKSMLSVFWDYYGLPPSRLSGFYYAVATGQFIKGGGYYYKPRSQALSDALARAVEQGGGRILYGREVERITLRDGAVSGARLRDGAHLPARTVISGASAPMTFQKLLPKGALPLEYTHRLASFKHSLSSFVVWLGLDQDVTDRIKDYEIFLISEYDHEVAYQVQCRSDPARADMSITLFDNAFKGYSAPGTSTMSLTFVCGYAPWARFETDYAAGRKGAYDAAKARVAETLIARAEEAVLPGLSGMIDLMVTASPLTNRRYTANPAGAIYGYEQSMDNSFNRRLDNRTPVPGLYLAGSWTFPGGGFSGCQASGRRAFEAFLKDWT